MTNGNVTLFGSTALGVGLAGKKGFKSFHTAFQQRITNTMHKMSLPASALYYTQAKAIVDMIGDQYFAVNSYQFVTTE